MLSFSYYLEFYLVIWKFLLFSQRVLLGQCLTLWQKKTKKTQKKFGS